MFEINRSDHNEGMELPPGDSNPSQIKSIDEVSTATALGYEKTKREAISKGNLTAWNIDKIPQASRRFLDMVLDSHPSGENIVIADLASGDAKVSIEMAQTLGEIAPDKNWRFLLVD